jgi:hypothetical protein
MTKTLSRPDTLVAHWRTSATDGNPAGPLFSSDYAEFDLTTQAIGFTGHSECTGSGTVSCC